MFGSFVCSCMFGSFGVCVISGMCWYCLCWYVWHGQYFCVFACLLCVGLFGMVSLLLNVCSVGMVCISGMFVCLDYVHVN